MTFVLALASAADTTFASPQPVTVPIRIVDNFPVIEVSASDRSFPVMFDLGGSDEIVLTTEVLDSIAVTFSADKYSWVDVKGNRLESRMFQVPELRIGALVLRNVSGHEDAEASTYRKEGAIKSYIGAELIEDFRLVIDYKNLSMTFIPTDHPDPADLGCSGAVVPFDPIGQGAPVTRVETDFGELPFVWDTGAPMSIIREELINGLGRKSSALYVPSEKFILSSRDFGPVRLRKLKFAEPAEVAGFVGYDFFAENVVCVEMVDRQLRIRPNA